MIFIFLFEFLFTQKGFGWKYEKEKLVCESIAECGTGLSGSEELRFSIVEVNNFKHN